MDDVELWIVPTLQWRHILLPVESIDADAGVLRTRIAF